MEAKFETVIETHQSAGDFEEWQCHEFEIEKLTSTS